MTGLARAFVGDADTLTIIAGIWIGMVATSFLYVFRAHTR